MTSRGSWRKLGTQVRLTFPQGNDFCSITLPQTSNPEEDEEKEEPQKIVCKPSAKRFDVSLRQLRKQIGSFLIERLSINLNQDVRPYKDPLCRKTMILKVSRVVNPFEIYLRHVNYPNDFDVWFAEMQHFYQKSENISQHQIKYGQPLKGRCYVYWDKFERVWHRCRVQRLLPESKSIEIYCMDVCRTVLAEFKDLLELNPRFAQSACQIFRCYLYDLVSTHSDPTNWSKASCDKVKELLNGKQFTGIVQMRSNIRVLKGHPDFVPVYGVVLVENLDNALIPAPNVCTINAQLVDAGLAVATGALASCKHMGYLPGLEPSYSNSCRVVRSSHQKETDPDVLLLPNGVTFENAEKAFGIVCYLKNTTMSLPQMFKCRIAEVDIVHVFTPTNVFVQLRSKQHERRAMEFDIGLESEEVGRAYSFESGTFAAVCVQDREKDGFIWNRGIVISVSPDDSSVYKVLLVDYGNEIKVSQDYMRPLPPRFETLPSFATRVHIAEENLLPVEGNTWSSNAIMEFREYIKYWDGQRPTYVMCKLSKLDNITLENYYDMIVYGRRQKTWVAHPVKSSQIIRQFRDRPSIKNLFSSVAVEIFYEVRVPSGNFWNFHRLTDKLLQKGHATKIGNEFTPEMLHAIIADKAI